LCFFVAISFAGHSLGLCHFNRTPSKSSARNQPASKSDDAVDSHRGHSQHFKLYQFFRIFSVFWWLFFARVERRAELVTGKSANRECCLLAIYYWLLTSYAHIAHKSSTANTGKCANGRLRLGNCCFTGAGFLRWPYDHGKVPVCHAAAGREAMDRSRESKVRLFASATAWNFFNIFGLRVASVWKRTYILRSILFYDD